MAGCKVIKQESLLGISKKIIFFLIENDAQLFEIIAVIK